jgi:uncharacterized protein
MIELHTPPHRRVYGYHVCPFLLGDPGRPLRPQGGSRAEHALMLQGAFLEPGQEARRVAPEMMEELDLMRAWLGLDRVEIGSRGELAATIHA